jgi:Fe-S oxidoreductase
LQQLWARWQESLATCTHCGTCASRCELFPEGSPGASELAQQGLHLLQELQGTSEDSAEPSVNPSERNASAAETDQTTLKRIVQRFAANNPDTLALVRRCSMCGHCTARCPVGISMPHLVRLWRQLLALGSALDPADLKSVQVDTEWHVFSVYRAVYGIAYPEFVSLESLDAGEADEAVKADKADKADKTDKTDKTDNAGDTNDAGEGDRASKADKPGEGDEKSEVDTLFFPGCSLVSYAPELVRSVGDWLTAHGYRWALSDACCGSPLNTHGVSERAQALKERIAAQCARAGIKQVVTVCAGCGEELAPVLEPQIEIVPLPALMQRAGERCVTEQIIAFFDSCHDRAQTHGAPLRALFEQAPTKAMEHERRDTLCCGAGGGVPSFDPELSDRRAARILQEGCAAGAQTVVVSCPTCAYTFASKRIMGSTAPLPEGVGTAHYLELLFSQPIDWEGVFQRLQAMWTGEYATWVYQQLVE